MDATAFLKNRYSQEVTKLETANLYGTAPKLETVWTHSLHLNDYKSEIKWWK